MAEPGAVGRRAFLRLGVGLVGAAVALSVPVSAVKWSGLPAEPWALERLLRAYRAHYGASLTRPTARRIRVSRALFEAADAQMPVWGRFRSVGCLEPHFLFKAHVVIADPRLRGAAVAFGA